MPKLRPNVAALILNRKGELLVCERKKTRGAWQFPQGGVDEGETDEEALYREVFEEVGIPASDLKLLDSRGDYSYLYPDSISVKKNWDGQKQTYFLCKLKKKAKGVKLGKNNPEFRDYKWVNPKQFDSDWLPEFKLDVYRQVMRDFFEVEL